MFYQTTAACASMQHGTTLRGEGGGGLALRVPEVREEHRILRSI
jgi:hypothetical protein